LDSVVDRIGEAAVLLGALGAISDSGVGICGTFVLLASSNLISYCRAKSEQLGGDLSGGLMQRGERAVILALGAILDHAYPGTLHQWLDLGPILGAKHPFLGAAICFAATLSFITAAGRVLRGYRELASKKEHE
jgi:phosphatidylglycerophosphate synthase